jgi:putative hydrolase of the HAD superfamily
METSPAIVFDLGKVLLNFDYAVAVRRLLAQSKCTLTELLNLINQSPLLLEYERGTLTTTAFYEKVRKVSGYEGSFEAFQEMFGDIFTPIPEMVQLHADLVARGYPVFIFSNTNDMAVRYIRGHFPFFSRFDGYVFSYEHASMKPEAALYEVVEKLTGRRGDQIIYLDDRAENIEAGRARGWRAFVHESPAVTRSWVESALAR